MAARRRRFLAKTALMGAAGGATLGGFAILSGRARAAEFTYKYANNVPTTHPLNVRAQEAVDKIKQESGGRVEIQIFPTTSSAATPTCCRRCARARSSSS